MKIIIQCLIFSLIFISSCSKKNEVLQGVVTFVSGNLKVNDKTAVVGDTVQANDILTTSSNSLAVVQISQTAVITLRSNTELRIDTLSLNKDQSQIVSVYLSKGLTFHKVIRKGTDYTAKTSTAVASVRGTSFEVNVDGTKNRIRLLNGNVLVNRVSNDTGANVSDEIKNNQVKEVELTAGQSIIITEEKLGKLVIIDKSGIDNLTQMDAISAVPDLVKVIPKKENTQSTETQGDQSGIILPNEVIPETVKEAILMQELKDVTPIEVLTPQEKQEEIKAIYVEKLNDIKIQNDGKLDKITLRNGDVIMGMITERGSKYKVLTPNGTIEILPRDIESQIITH